jgi:Tol biopolymer transport system component
MLHRIRWAGTWALLLVVLATACSDSPAGPGQGPDYTPIRVPQPNTGPLTLHDNVVVIDSTVLHLASSPTEIAAGTYRFDVLGSPVPLIEVGDVIVGVEALGFMGTGTSISYGTQVVVQTTQAYLGDVIAEGSLDVSEPLDFSAPAPAPGSALAQYHYMAPGVSSDTTRLFQIDNVDLCDLAKKAKEAGLPGIMGCPEGISLTLPSGHVDFAADGLYKLDKRLGLLFIDELLIGIEGSLEFDVVAKAVAKQGFEMGDEVVLRSLSVPIPMPAGANLVVNPRLLFSLKAGWGAKAEVEARVESGVQLRTGVRIGGEWTYLKYDQTGSGWTGIWLPSFSAELKETSWAAQGSGHVRVYIRPDVQLVMLGLEGPRMGIEPNLKVSGEVGTESCEMRLTRSTDANAELFAHFVSAGVSTDTVPFDWPGPETNLIDPIPCPIGHLKVVTTTNGDSPDLDGYTVTLDGIDTMTIASNGSVMYSPLPPTSYSVLLSGMSENCTTSVNPRQINVSEGDTTVVAFPVNCGAVTGDIKVNTMTTGEDDGYSVVVDGDVAGAMPIGVDGTVTFESLAAGDHTVELTDFGTSCVVSDDNPRTVAVTDAVVETDFQVDCGLTVTVATTGTDLDPDGYDVVVDGGSPTNLADINGTLWLDIAPGVHSIELTGLADNCSVTGDNPRDTTAPGEETFDVACEGSDVGGVVTYSMDGDLWQLNPDGTGDQQLTTDGAAPNEYAHHSWSPDGTRMAFTKRVACGSNDCNTVFTSDEDGTNLVQVSHPAPDEGDSGPRWSPDGTKIVFWRRSEVSASIYSIRTVDPDGTNETEVLASVSSDLPSVQVTWPTWTPAGRIAFVERVNDAGCESLLKQIDADGSGESVLFGGLPCNGAHHPRVSPDGSQVLLPLPGDQGWECIAGGGHGGSCLWVMGIDGSNLTNLTGSHVNSVLGADWSPDGSQIAFSGAVGSTTYYDIWLMDADGSNVSQETSEPRNEIQPAWRTLP